jgi:hypothetical protein
MRRWSALMFAACFVLLSHSRADAQGPVVLRVEGDHFTINGQPRFLTFISYFDALHVGALNNPSDRYAKWNADLELLKTRFNGVRIFPNWYADYCSSPSQANVLDDDTLFNYNGTLNQNTLNALTSFIALADAKGMVVDVSFSRETVKTAMPATPNYQAALVAAAVALAPYKNVVIDIQNEFTKGGAQGLSATEIDAIVPAMRQAAVTPVILSGSGGGYSDIGDMARNHGFDFVAYHDDRVTDWQDADHANTQLSAIRSDLGINRKPIYFQEPTAFDLSVNGCGTATNQTDGSITHHTDAVKWAKHYGAAAWTFHTRSTFNLRNTSLSAKLGANATLQSAVDAIQPAVVAKTHWGLNAWSITAGAGTLTDAGGSRTLTLSANESDGTIATWTASVNVSWLHLGATQGSGTSLGISWDPNPNGAPRFATVELSSGHRVTFKQMGQMGRLRKTWSDYDADGKSDLAVYRETNGEWHISTSSPTVPDQHVSWGAPSLLDVPVPADYDGDGKADYAVFRRQTNEWYIWGSATQATLGVFAFGLIGDVPVPGKYATSSRAQIAVYRPSNGTWYVRDWATGSATAYGWGAARTFDPNVVGYYGDVPVPADYDGDGRDDIAIYRDNPASADPGWWHILYSGGGAFVGAWGSPGLNDVPISGDYDGDHIADLAIYRPGTAQWYIRLSSGGATVLAWGNPLTDTPIRGDFDGDGKTDVGIYRTTTGEWLVLLSSTGALYQVGWGSAGLRDAPLF